MAKNSHITAWFLAARPKTLPAGAMPVLIGTAMAFAVDSPHWPSALAALLGALLIQIATNFANDYSDFVKGTDTEDRIGPVRAVQAGLISAQAMKRAMLITFALVFIPGAYILHRGGMPFLVIGLASILSGYLYTGGPYPLGYLGLGDLFVLVFFGPVAVGGTFYLQTYSLPSEVIVAGFAPGLFSVAILCVNNLRDADGDVLTGKKTLAVRFGKTFAKFEYLIALLIAAAAIPIYLILKTGTHHWALFGMLALLPAIPNIRTVFTNPDGPALNDALANTGKLLVVFSILFSIGWVI